MAVRHCCPDDARRYDFTLSGPEQRERPYRSLEVRAVSSRQGTRGPERTGELFNAGNLSVNAPSLDLYAAYWRGSDLIDLRTANLPVLWSLGGPVGQALPPDSPIPSLSPSQLSPSTGSPTSSTARPIRSGSTLFLWAWAGWMGVLTARIWSGGAS